MHNQRTSFFDNEVETDAGIHFTYALAKLPNSFETHRCKHQQTPGNVSTQSGADFATLQRWCVNNA